MKNILIFGKISPPVGGVTKFVERLLEASKTCDDVKVELASYKNIFSRVDAVHINASRPFKRLLIVVFCRLLFKNVYFTIHGGHARPSNLFNRLSFYLAQGVFCLTKEVEAAVSDYCSNTFRHTTIFEENKKSFYSLCKERISRNESKRILLYINNADSLFGKEIYGATFVADSLRGYEELLGIELVVVDLSGEYAELFSSIVGCVYVNQQVNFLEMLASCDVYIRPTSTDGMSVALLEAQLMGVQCLASDVVERPKSVLLYRYEDSLSFREQLKYLLSLSNEIPVNIELTRVNHFIARLL